MKKRIMVVSIVLVLALLCTVTACAAGLYGTATIKSGGTGKVHLRMQPSTSAQSMGLYYAGTPVYVDSTVNDQWVRVTIGMERGYMMSQYVTTRGDYTDRRPTYWVNLKSTSWVNLRETPSTDARVLGRIYGGNSVLVLGETNTRWTYIQYGGTYGYVMSQYLSSGGVMPTAVPTTQPYVMNPVTVERVADRYIAQMDPAVFFNDAYGASNGMVLAFFANQQIKNFSYYSIQSNYINGRLTCTSATKLFNVKNMKNGDVARVDTIFAGLLPDRAVAFTDARGHRYAYALQLSGQDGTVQMVSIDVYANGSSL